MKLLVVLASIVFAASAADADEQAECRANDGTFLTGRVIAGPTFRRAREWRKGVPLSHTHVTLVSDQKHQTYDVAIDNVFAKGYDAAGSRIPAPLSSLRTGDRLELCGRTYQDNEPGIDWVHTNCGDPPTADKPNGWLKVLAADYAPGPNLESSENYCYLWKHRHS